MLAAPAQEVAMQGKSALPAQLVLTPYIIHDANTPTADKVLLDKLDRIVSKYGVGSGVGLSSPFIITGHAIELNKETTATAPPQTVVDLSLTLYIGNGEEGTVFSTCNMNLRGVGKNLDAAYASAFRKLNINDPELDAAIKEGRARIAKYYAEAGPGLIKQAEALVASGDYAGAYGVLLRIPPVCPQYDEAQDLLLAYVQREADSRNGDVVARARAAWSANPTPAGADAARTILAEMTNVSPTMRQEANGLLKDIATRLQSVEDAERAAERAAEANAHAERMAEIESATKVAVAEAKAREKQTTTYVYRFYWW